MESMGVVGLFGRNSRWCYRLWCTAGNDGGGGRTSMGEPRLARPRAPTRALGQPEARWWRAHGSMVAMAIPAGM
ncbi:hypothetical protein M6B38_275940 [Iris pallida]|uniref:Uncharacterized protein n=1 Tax=Iris pallida TaxID=29817 RepID=A0AAX6GMQ0_IRIPA|nr:hypothetical protein M6B38_125920 [Iris pallida]KAJ6847762.1 hypothetical protein M6B38_275940 [Iris pallida]